MPPYPMAGGEHDGECSNGLERDSHHAVHSSYGVDQLHGRGRVPASLAPDSVEPRDSGARTTDSQKGEEDDE